MQLNFNIFHLFSLLIIVVLFCLELFQINSSESISSFSRQIEEDFANDWIYFPFNSNSNCSGMSSAQIPDIIGATYFSDNNYLNTTLWLSGTFQELPLPIIFRAPTYSMTIGLVNPFDTQIRTDYILSIQWNASSFSWIRTLEELLSNGTTRIIEQDPNYKNFVDNSGNKSQINLSLDLHKISSPNEFAIAFSSFDIMKKKNNLCGLRDVIERSIYIPPPKFTINLIPSIVELKKGEEKKIDLKINSSSLDKPLILLNSTNPYGINVDIEPPKTFIEPGGTSTVFVNVKIPKGITAQSYPIQINSNMLFPKTIDIDSLSGSFIQKIPDNTKAGIDIGETIYGSKELNSKIISKSFAARPIYFSVIVKSDLSYQEQFKDFWSVYGDIISLVTGGLVAGSSALIIDKIKRRRKWGISY